MKYEPCLWSALLSGVAEYLGGIYQEFGVWLSVTSNPDDVAFNDWWAEWVRLEDASYKEVEDEEEAYKAEENPLVAEIRGAERWHMHSQFESEYDFFQGWLVDEEIGYLYDCFVLYLIAWCAAREYPGPSVCHLRGW